MKPVTAAINTNERAMSIREENLVRPPSNQWHRYQIIVVVRGDELAEWWDDLGPAENFKGDEFQVPSLLEYSVAELRDIAEQLRNDTTWSQERARITAESTLINDWIDQTEERREIIRNRSKFGPGFTKQRIGFPREALHGNTH